MGRPLQQDENGNIMNDEVTKENQRAYAKYEADLKKQPTSFKDSDMPISEKIGRAIGNVAMPIMEGVARMAGRDKIMEKQNYRDQQKLQKQYEAQDKQEGKKMKKGGVVSSASKRADGCAIKGKTRGKMV